MSQAFDPSAKISGERFASLLGARVLAALEAVKTATALTVTDQKHASSLIVRQQAELEALQEAGQRLGARGRDVRNSLQLVRESVDRAKLTALNAGLEGARLGEPLGKALVVMGDEVRNLLARALDAIEEHATLLAEVDRDRERCQADLGRVHDGTRELGQDLARAEQHGQLSAALLAELRTDLGDAFGTDPEAARILANSATQVSALASSLLELSQRSPLSDRALHELLEPLLSLVPAYPERER